jgi:dihydroorotate dehydrogenase
MLEEKLNINNTFIDNEDESDGSEGITYEEALESAMNGNEETILSTETNDLTVILAYGVIASTIDKLLEENRKNNIVCMIANKSIKELDETYKTEFEEVVSYCREAYEYSNKKECELIINMYNKCY